MLINCPKCGFEQPKDQFCASCGVNLNRYKKRQKPLIDKVLSNANFYAICLLLITIATSYYLANNWNDDDNHFAFTPNSYEEEIASEAQNVNHQPTEEYQDPQITNTPKKSKLNTTNKASAEKDLRLSIDFYLVHFPEIELQELLQLHSIDSNQLTFTHVSQKIKLLCSEILGTKGNLLQKEVRSSDRSIEAKFILGQNRSESIDEYQGYFLDVTASGDLDISYLNLQVSFNLLSLNKNEQVERNNYNFQEDIEFRDKSCFLLVTKVDAPPIIDEKQTTSPLSAMSSLTYSEQNSHYLLLMIGKSR